MRSNAAATKARSAAGLGSPSTRFESSAAQREELARRFFAAARDGDLGALEALLADDVVLQGDGGGKAPALARALLGRARVARTLLAWMRAARRIPGARLEPVLVNGEPGVIGYDGEGRVVTVMALEIDGGYVRGVRSIVNPDKLRHLGPVADLGALMKQA